MSISGNYNYGGYGGYGNYGGGSGASASSDTSPLSKANDIQLSGGSQSGSATASEGKSSGSGGGIGGFFKGIVNGAKNAVKSLFTPKGLLMAAAGVAACIAFPVAAPLALAGVGLAAGGMKMAQGAKSGDMEQVGEGFFTAGTSVLGGVGSGAARSAFSKSGSSKTAATTEGAAATESATANTGTSGLAAADDAASVSGRTSGAAAADDAASANAGTSGAAAADDAATANAGTSGAAAADDAANASKPGLLSRTTTRVTDTAMGGWSNLKSAFVAKPKPVAAEAEGAAATNAENVGRFQGYKNTVTDKLGQYPQLTKAAWSLPAATALAGGGQQYNSTDQIA